MPQKAEILQEFNLLQEALELFLRAFREWQQNVRVLTPKKEEEYHEFLHDFQTFLTFYQDFLWKNFKQGVISMSDYQHHLQLIEHAQPLIKQKHEDNIPFPIVIHMWHKWLVGVPLAGSVLVYFL